MLQDSFWSNFSLFMIRWYFFNNNKSIKKHKIYTNMSIFSGFDVIFLPLFDNFFAWNYSQFVICFAYIESKTLFIQKL